MLTVSHTGGIVRDAYPRFINDELNLTSYYLVSDEIQDEWNAYATREAVAASVLARGGGGFHPFVGRHTSLGPGWDWKPRLSFREWLVQVYQKRTP